MNSPIAGWGRHTYGRENKVRKLGLHAARLESTNFSRHLKGDRPNGCLTKDSQSTFQKCVDNSTNLVWLTQLSLFPFYT